MMKLLLFVVMAVYPYDDGLRDPFKPASEKAVKAVPAPAPAKTVEAPPPYAIDGMLWDEKNPSAVLRNNRTGESRMVEKGTVWDDIKVIDIKQDRVIVRYGKKDFTIQ